MNSGQRIQKGATTHHESAQTRAPSGAIPSRSSYEARSVQGLDPGAHERTNHTNNDGGGFSRITCSRIVVVEDGRRLREMLVDAISLMGMEPHGAPTAEAAIEMLDRNLYTTVIVDLNLPGIGGLELCEIMRRRWPQVQIIVLTAFGNLDAARRAIRLDVVDFLTKPCSMSDLEVALGRARARWIERCSSGEQDSPHQQHAPEQQIESAIVRSGVSMDEMEREAIFGALERHAGSREAAASELGISVRKLYYRLQQYQKEGLPPPS